MGVLELLFAACANGVTISCGKRQGGSADQSDLQCSASQTPGAIPHIVTGTYSSRDHKPPSIFPIPFIQKFVATNNILDSLFQHPSP